MLGPERAGKGIIIAQAVVLRADCLMGDAVLFLEPPVDAARIGPHETRERPDGDNRANTECDEHRNASPVRNHPEDAEPGEDEEERDNARQRRGAIEQLLGARDRAHAPSGAGDRPA